MEEFWKKLIGQLGRRTLYVDTGAILGALERGNDRFTEFFGSAVGYRFVTSTYVLTETVRRLVKSNTPNQFVGPGGERLKQLSLYVLRQWLADHNVYVICISEDLFESAKEVYGTMQQVQCDLTDIISFTIVSGLEQREILSDDRHFSELGLSCLP